MLEVHEWLEAFPIVGYMWVEDWIPNSCGGEERRSQYAEKTVPVFYRKTSEHEFYMYPTANGYKTIPVGAFNEHLGREMLFTDFIDPQAKEGQYRS